MTTWYVDLVNGNNSANGETYTNRKLTIADVAAVAGDTIRVMGNAATSSGTATWTNNSNLVTLSSSLSQLLYADGTWTTLSTKATCSSVTSSPSPKQGSNSAEMACASTFTTAAAIAYFPTGSALNLSSYQQISLWVQVSAALAASSLRIDLCSDTAGATVVNSLTISQALNAGSWTNITLNNGAALGSSIQSIRVYALKTVASKNIFIDNVVACAAPSAADCLTLGTLISPSSTGPWYSVQSIDGTSVYIDALESTAAQAAPGYQGATGSSTFYMLQPTQVTINTASTDFAQSSAKNGSSGSPITISGGWDSATMTTQSGWTIIDCMDWTESGINLTGTTGYITLDHFIFTRCNTPLGLVTTAKGYELSNSTFVGTSLSLSPSMVHSMTVASCNFLNANASAGADGTAMIYVPASTNYATDGTAWSITNCNVFGCPTNGIFVEHYASSPGITITGCNCSGNTIVGFDLNSNCGGGFYNNIANNNGGGFGFTTVYGLIGYNLQARGNGGDQVGLSNSWVEIYGLDTNTPGGSSAPQIVAGSGKAIVYNWLQYTGTSPPATLCDLEVNGIVFSHRENDIADDNSIYSTVGTITTTDITGESGSGMAWQLSPNSSAIAGWPLRLNIGKIFCPAGVETGIAYFAGRSASGVSAQLRIPGGRYAGVGSPGSDITTAVTATTLTQSSISITPTQNCVVDVFFEAWGSSTEMATISAPVLINS